MVLFHGEDQCFELEVLNWYLNWCTYWSHEMQEYWISVIPFSTNFALEQMVTKIIKVGAKRACWWWKKLQGSINLNFITMMNSWLVKNIFDIKQELLRKLQTQFLSINEVWACLMCVCFFYLTLPLCNVLFAYLNKMKTMNHKMYPASFNCVSSLLYLL